ncbi:MAG TPA: DUF1588 domain-containing protein [Nannocystaceae bacterium]|nr:DUF1588 domain-containing protein [Nannocystaceae bacterium]
MWVSLAGLIGGCHDDASHPSVAETGSSSGAVEATTGTTGSEADSGPADSSSSGGEPVAPPVDAAPGGIRRLRADQYIATVRSLFGPEAAEAASPPADQPLSGFDSVGNAQLPLSPAMVEAYEQSALAVAKAVVEYPAQLSGYIPCVTTEWNEGCYVKVAEDLGRIMWRRELTFDEVDMLVDLARAAQTTNDGRFELGLRFEIAMLLQSPDFIYTVELGEARDDGKIWLTTDEWVTRASLFVLGRAPDPQTIARIDAGELDGEDAPRTLALEMLDRPEARIAVGRFFDELLRVREVVTKAKDPELYPLFTPERAASMRQETLQLVQHVVFSDESDKNLLGIFDADYTFVDAQLAELYGLPIPVFDSFEKTELPASQGRLGVLSHPALLAVASHHDRNSPTRRGLFVQRTLLCNEVPPPPGDVDTTLPEPSEETTLRARMEGHIAQGGICTGCHVQTDPIGFAFEYFDASGVRRELDNGFPIDASGSVDGIGEFSNAAELALLIRDDPRIGPCLVRNLYRHAIGRVEDEGTIDAMVFLSDGFTATNQDMQQLIVDMVDNPAFRQVGEPQ